MNHPEIRIEAPISLINFTVMDDQALESTRKNLGLSMSPAEFRACRNYYKNTLHKDPQIEELFLLEGLVAAASREPEYLRLSEMKTDSALIAEIFSDLMMRRRAVIEDLEHPSSLAELIGILNAYLSAIDKKKKPHSDIRVYFTQHRDLLLACAKSRLIASTGNRDLDVTIGIEPKSSPTENAIKRGDYVFAILDTKNQPEDLEERLIAFLKEEAVRSVCKKAVPLCNRGVLHGLLQMANGLTLNTDALLRETDTLSTLTEPSFGALITAPPSASSDMLLLANEMGLHIIRAATVTEGREVRIPTKNGDTVFLASFLRDLTLPRVYSATVATPTASDLDILLSRIGTCTLNGHKHALVKTDSSGSNPFFSALYGTLYAFLWCFAAGANPTEIEFSCHLKLPRPSPSRMGEAISAILGLYRAQAEFELGGNTPTVEQGNEEHPSLIGVALAPLPEKAIPSAAIGGGTEIYYLEPLYDPSGIPDFDDFKRMLAYIEKLNRDGHILSMTPTSDHLMADLKKMSRTVTVEYIQNDPLSSRFGGLLVETDISIQGTAVAKTEAFLPSLGEACTANDVGTENTSAEK